MLEPSKLFYIHDTDSVLLNATSWTIFNYANELYLDSKADDIPSNIQGTQVVVAYIGDESTYNTTEIFNAWGIGENDMGILITVLYSKEGDNINYENVLFEIDTIISMNSLISIKTPFLLMFQSTYIKRQRLLL